MFRLAVFSAAVVIAAVAVVSGLINSSDADVVTRGAAAVSNAVGLVTAVWTGLRSRGAERRWRLLVAVAFAGAQVPLIGLFRAAQDGRVFPVMTGRDALYLLSYVPLLAGILACPTVPLTARDSSSGAPGARRRWHVLVALDSLLVVGSLVILSRITLLRHTIPDPTRLTIIGVSLAANILVVVAAILVASFRRPCSVSAFSLLAGGAVVRSLSVAAFLHSLAHGPPRIAAPFVIGLVAGPLLMALACLASPATGRDDMPAEVSAHALWAHAALPYLPFATVAVVGLALLPTRWTFDEAELYGLLVLLLVALTRQMIILADNSRLLRHIHHQALHDPLTGLANRALFADRLALALARHVRHRQTLALLFCDLDDFKDINDSLGHAAGDEMLRTTAARLTACVRPTDTVARLGGDEFCVLMEGNKADPEAVGRRIIEAVRRPATLSAVTPARDCTVHVSAGLVIAEKATVPLTPEALLHSADVAMYTAKHQRKGELVVRRAG